MSINPDQSISVVVCDDCQRALFVNGHPRNFCGHSGRGTLTEFVPKSVADGLAEGLREALIDVGAKGVDDPYTMKGARIGREALERYKALSHAA